MYFPKSQIKSNLYTKGGEYTNSQTGEIYIGSYFITSTNKAYSGRNPSDIPNVLLNPIKLQPTTPITESKPTQLNKSFWASSFLGYNPAISKTNSQQYPIQYYPQPTQEEYNLEEFQRYFVKRTNEPKFIEINKTQYDKYLSKDPQVAYQLYTPFSIPWEISGDRNKVYNTNKNTVERIEKQQQLWGLKSYFKDRYTQFYK